MDDNNKIVYSKEVIEFTAVANEYCQYLETASEYEGKLIIKIMQKLLPLLYSKTLYLPENEPVLDDQTEQLVTENDWNTVHDGLLLKFGGADDFLEVYDERQENPEGPFAGSIAENMTDIYQDLKNFLMLYSMGTTEIMNDALWQCQENFRLYWGQKLVNTIRAVHYVMLNPDMIGSSIPEKTNSDTSDWIISKRQEQHRKEENDDL